MAKQKRYTKEFRLEAARLVAEQGYILNEAAQRLGVSGWSISNWIRKFRQAGALAPADAPQPVRFGCLSGIIKYPSDRVQHVRQRRLLG